MTPQSNEKVPVISDYLYVLYKWKKFIIINLFIVSILAAILAFLIPNQYKATTTIMIPESDQSGLGSLGSFLGSSSSLGSLGSQFLGISNTSEDLVLGILYSRTTLTKIIKKYNLIDYYEIDDNNMDKAIKAFREDLDATPNEYELIEISVTNKDSILCADMANYIVGLVDSTNIQINMESAKNNRTFIEKRYLQNVNDLKEAEDSLYVFQSKYRIVAIPEQLEVSIKAAAEIESELMQKEMKAVFIKQQYGENSLQYGGAMTEIDLLKEKVKEFKNPSQLTSSSNVFYPFKNMPDMSIKYLRLYRDVEIQQSILEIVLPMYEQAKVEEQKSIPTIMVVDEAVPPQLKDSPKRAFIVIGIFLLVSFFLIPFLIICDRLVTMEVYNNPLEKKSAAVVSKIVKFYRIKF